jgi:hypothetical protein
MGVGVVYPSSATAFRSGAINMEKTPSAKALTGGTGGGVAWIT